MTRIAALFRTTYISWRSSYNPTTKLPKWLIWAIVGISIFPSILNGLGIDFGSTPPIFNGLTITHQAYQPFADPFAEDILHQTLSGSFTHTILEWSAFCAALFTVILAFSHFSIKRDVTTPIIGVTLLCAGSLDAFHTLAADRLIDAVADNQNLIPFTWALCRLCNAVLTIIGVSVLLSGAAKRWRGNTLFVILMCLGFGILAYGLIHQLATTPGLPQTTFPNAILPRPWDVIPLGLFLVSGLFIYPRFYHKYPSLFSHALMISTIPNAATQFHMAFGSSALFDNHFNIAHFLKIIAYMVPLAGLILDYTHTHREIQHINQSLRDEVEERKQVQIILQEKEAREREKSQQLEHALQELQQTQAQLVHSERMSSLGQLVAGIAHEINNPVNFIHGNLHHAHHYMQDLLDLLQLYQKQFPRPGAEICLKAEEIDLDFLQHDLPNLLSSIQVGADRIQSIVQSLRVFSRLDEAEVKAVDIHEGIDSTLMILHHRLKAKPDRPEIQVIKNYGNLPKIECYAGQMNQVFMNILSNAIDALDEKAFVQSLDTQLPDTQSPEIQLPDTQSPDTQSPEIQLPDTQSPEMQSPNHHATHSGRITISTVMMNPDRILIRIADNGPGLTPATQHRLFTPFFTTKPVGKGTGMGLSISYQIVTANHKGLLRCSSSPGKGAAFIIEIPTRLSGPNSLLHPIP